MKIKLNLVWNNTILRRACLTREITIIITIGMIVMLLNSGRLIDSRLKKVKLLNNNRSQIH